MSPWSPVICHERRFAYTIKIWSGHVLLATFNTSQMSTVPHMNAAFLLRRRENGDGVVVAYGWPV